MADRETQPHTEPASDRSGCKRREGFSFGLFVTGLLAVLVSLWALTGPAPWTLPSIVPVGWIVVAAAIVVGLVLVISPRKRR